jgi:nitroreductase
MNKNEQSRGTQELNALLDARWSCRAFHDEPVARPVVESILAMAQKTASWCNGQSWQVSITSGDATRRLSAALIGHINGGGQDSSDFEFPREYRGVYLERRRRSGFQLYQAMNIPRGDKAGYQQQTMRNFRFFGAPHVAIITTDEALGVYGAVDCGGYVSNFLLAATAHGVASIAQAALARYAGTVKDALGISPDRRMVCGISFGYPDRGHPANSYRTDRAAVEQVMDWVAH